MKLKYKITKDRGFDDLLLSYRFEKTKEEVDLCIVPIERRITGTDFNPESKSTFGHKIEFPTSRSDSANGRVYISSEFAPVIEKRIAQIFGEIMGEYDKNFQAAFDCKPINIDFEIDHSKIVKEKLAPIVAAKKMLNNKKPADDADDLF